jgi:RNA polymerase sigma-70 factor (ECF subfamily)
VTQHAWSDFVTARSKDPGHGAGPVDTIADSAEAQSDLEQKLQDAFERELLELAMHRVKQRVKPGTWDAFQLTAIEGNSGADAARKLQVPVAHVFVVKNRVHKMLQEEVAILKTDPP